ncbi:BolA-like protein [[Candida] zeylanoides]
MLRAVRRMATQFKLSPNAGPIETKIATKLQQEFQPTYLSVVNESHKHAHHAGVRGATNKTESHFNLEVVSPCFEGKNMPTRHRMIYSLLADEINIDKVHALSMKTKTPQEVAIKAK